MRRNICSRLRPEGGGRGGYVVLPVMEAGRVKLTRKAFGTLAGVERCLFDRARLNGRSADRWMDELN